MEKNKREVDYKRLELLIAYHSNLTDQFIHSKGEFQQAVGEQLDVIECEIHRLLFADSFEELRKASSKIAEFEWFVATFFKEDDK